MALQVLTHVFESLIKQNAYYKIFLDMYELLSRRFQTPPNCAV